MVIDESFHALVNDNMAAICWLQQGSTMATSTSAYLLCKQVMHCWHHYYTMTYDHIPSHHNSMANNCLQLWQLNDNTFLTHVNSHYPQVGGWKLCHLSNTTNSTLTSMLQQQRPTPELFLLGPLQPTGTGLFGHCEEIHLSGSQQCHEPTGNSSSAKSTQGRSTRPLRKVTFSQSGPTMTRPDLNNFSA